MNSLCPFFNTRTKTLQSRTISTSRRTTRIETAWCELPGHSPVPEWKANRTIGHGNDLKCEGRFEKCPVQEHLLAELDK
ncbi:MAG: hypothetical protein QNJ44_00885 [Rhodobacter sp.]|nr:hypothetical protein [Rhodobacter sp.]